MKSGTYIDEKIIRQRSICRNRNKTCNLLTDEMVIRGKKIRFVFVPLFSEKVFAILPDSFIKMPEKIAKVRYITNYRPPEIYTNSDYDENFGFHLLSQEMFPMPLSIDSLINQMKNTILIHAPETVVYDSGSILTGDLDGRWFEYKNFTLDDETYNLQFIIHSGVSILAGTFNCRMAYYDQWKKTVLESLKDLKMAGEGAK